MIGILGTDGVFRVRRTGDSISTGEVFQYASVVSDPDAADTDVTVTTNGWDGVRRWTVARELYGFPLAVLVGLSADEREGAALRAMHGRLTLESALRHALERNEFHLHYQAKRDIGSGRITGMEALLRWAHPDLGTIAPTGLADAIIAMGKSLSLTVVAQGVETREQAEFLRTHACDELQGFYFNRPLPADQFTQLLLAQANEITYTGKSLVLRTM